MIDRDAERAFLERRCIYLSLREAAEEAMLHRQYEDNRKRGVVPIYVYARMTRDDPRRQELEAAEEEARREKARREELRLRNLRQIYGYDYW